MQENVLCVYKPLGKTPLEMVKQVQQRFPQYSNLKIGYAGRLDPMAEGLLLLLIDKENKRKKWYENLPKTYMFSVLFGIATDTYDTLGEIINTSKKIPDVHQIINLLPSFLGKHQQPYPPYSAANVKGKPLYYWARNKKLSEISIPQKTIAITHFTYTKSTFIKKQQLQKEVTKRITLVSGDFRQSFVDLSWKNFLSTTNIESFLLVSFLINCSSGTYVRSIADSLGKKLNSSSLAYTISRTAIGDYSLSNAHHILTR